jgi:CelD/BcsL family acetyltransferase involved in cellulose biosynthesis
MPYDVRREELAALALEWSDLLARCDDPVPFMHPTWHRVWLEEFGGDREPFLLSIRDGGRLAGVAPLLRDGDKLSFIGHYSICDYMDFTVPKDGAGDVFAALLDALQREPWAELELRGLRDTSVTLAEFIPQAREAGMSVEQADEAVAPHIALPKQWEEYQSALPKKDRHELRRKLRKLQAAGELELRIHTSPQDVEERITTLLRLMVESRGDKAAFMSEQMGRFFHRMAPAMAGESLVRLYELELDTKPVASVLCLQQGGQLYFYNSGYDPQYAGLSVGLASKAFCIRDAIECGSHCADFLRGKEPYKYDLGGQDRQVYKVTIRKK